MIWFRPASPTPSALVPDCSRLVSIVYHDLVPHSGCQRRPSDPIRSRNLSRPTPGLLSFAAIDAQLQVYTTKSSDAHYVRLSTVGPPHGCRNCPPFLLYFYSIFYYLEEGGAEAAEGDGQVGEDEDRVLIHVLQQHLTPRQRHQGTSGQPTVVEAF
jgi:hypothetical protein